MADIDLDLLSPLIQRAKFRLMGLTRSYQGDSQDFARALIEAAEQIERLRSENERLVEGYARTLIERLRSENERLGGCVPKRDV